MGFVESLRDDDEGFVRAAKGLEELPGGRDGSDGIVLAVDEKDGVEEFHGVLAGADGSGGESLEHAGGHAMMDQVGIGHCHQEIKIARETGGDHVGVLGEGGPDACGDAGKRDLPAWGDESEAEPR